MPPHALVPRHDQRSQLAVRASNPDATFVSLGAGILRAETACWAGLAVAAAALGRPR